MSFNQQFQPFLIVTLRPHVPVCTQTIHVLIMCQCVTSSWHFLKQIDGPHGQFGARPAVSPAARHHITWWWELTGDPTYMTCLRGIRPQVAIVEWPHLLSWWPRVTGLDNTDGKALVICLISKIRIDDTLCVRSPMLLHRKKPLRTISFGPACFKRKSIVHQECRTGSFLKFETEGRCWCMDQP